MTVPGGGVPQVPTPVPRCCIKPPPNAPRRKGAAQQTSLGRRTPYGARDSLSPGTAARLLLLQNIEGSGYSGFSRVGAPEAAECLTKKQAEDDASTMTDEEKMVCAARWTMVYGSMPHQRCPTPLQQQQPRRAGVYCIVYPRLVYSVLLATT
jgi:hypothetical protein